jgi:hypothetical protein
MGMGRLDLRSLRNLSIPGANNAGNPQHVSLYEKQRSFMFNARITLPFINSAVNSLMPFFGQWLDVFTYSIITTNIPGKEREHETKRFMDETWTAPKGDDWDHTWDCQIRASEIEFEMDIIRYWFNYVKMVDNLDDAKGSVKVELVKLDGQTINRVFDLRGVYPLSIPEVKNLNHDDKLGNVLLDCSFAFDQIKYGPLDVVFDTLDTFDLSPI